MILMPAQVTDISGALLLPLPTLPRVRPRLTTQYHLSNSGQGRMRWCQLSLGYWSIIATDCV